MTFTVDPRALRQYGKHLSEAAEDARVARAYIITQGDLSVHESGLLTGYLSFDSLANRLHPAHQTFSNEIASTLTYLCDLLDGCEIALKTTAAWYEETDRRSASRLDATYPRVNRPSPEPEG